MRKWKYVFITRETLEEFEESANKLGDLGWELVSFVRVGQGMFFTGAFKK